MRLAGAGPWNRYRLALDGCVNITDVGMFNLTANCRGLVTVTVNHCNLLTDVSLGNFGQLPILSALSAKHCPEYVR